MIWVGLDNFNNSNFTKYYDNLTNDDDSILKGYNELNKTYQDHLVKLEGFYHSLANM